MPCCLYMYRERIPKFCSKNTDNISVLYHPQADCVFGMAMQMFSITSSISQTEIYTPRLFKDWSNPQRQKTRTARNNHDDGRLKFRKRHKKNQLKRGSPCDRQKQHFNATAYGPRITRACHCGEQIL
nr:uncharacterized protein LOC109619342 [Crassostrea gigas]